MPTRPPHPCPVPGCPNLTTDRYCTKHAYYDRRADRDRGSAASRGYDARWRRIRAQVLREQPICALCAAQGNVAAATDVHHIDGDQHNLSRSNLIALCHEHHSQITAGNKRTLAMLEAILTDRRPRPYSRYP